MDFLKFWKQLNDLTNIIVTLQDPELETVSQVQPTENNNLVHRALLNEIDSAGPKTETKRKTGKKENTLTRMLKGMRVDKSNQDESEDKLGAHISISKIFHRINPVGKASRENFSKVFHRIGDALQKKGEGEDCSASQDRTLENRGWDRQPEAAKSNHGDQKCPTMIGEKMFRCRPSNTDARKTTGWLWYFIQF